MYPIYSWGKDHIGATNGHTENLWPIQGSAGVFHNHGKEHTGGTPWT